MKDVENHIKDIVSSPSYDFLKNAITVCMQKLKIALYPKIDFMYLLEKTTHPKILKLGLYLPWMNIYRFGLGICEILLFFRFYRPLNLKNPILPPFFAFNYITIWETYQIWNLSGKNMTGKMWPCGSWLRNFEIIQEAPDPNHFHRTSTEPTCMLIIFT